MSGKVVVWTVSNVAKALEILGKHETVGAAIPEISKVVGHQVTMNAVRSAVMDRVGRTMGECLKKRTFTPNHRPGTDRFTKLVSLVRQSLPYAELCDKLDMSPRRTHELIEAARKAGLKIHVEHSIVGLKFDEPLERVQATKISPLVGKRQSVAVISDTHLGSKYCLRDQLKDFIHRVYDRGVREILHPGDALDGQYRHGVYEVTHVGIDEQTRDLFETLPQLPGLTYHGITGNHDNTFTESSGVDAGEFISSYFRKRGRNDFTFYGNRGAFLKIRGAVVHLWHPRSGGAYAISYPLQKKIEGYAALKPQILLAGHWHRYTHCTERGIEAFACPTFQAGRSAFSKSLTGAPAIGGLTLSWDLTRDGTIREFALEKRMYFEAERPVEIFNTVDGDPVEPEEQLVEVRRAPGARKK